MDDASHRAAGDSNNNNRRRKQRETTTMDDGGGSLGENSEVWEAFSNNFREVQSVLDRNRALIQQVNENHQSRIHDNMVKNVALIQEIHGNISKVVSLYSDFSTDFFSGLHQRNNKTGDADADGEGNGSHKA
uniref:Protein EARLY FLOWERING 4 domain-containing protein n=1 Tax=Rhizophora mucronata TaxID=61149 RepID=A0A2P2P0R2_RHIMU